MARRDEDFTPHRRALWMPVIAVVLMTSCTAIDGFRSDLADWSEGTRIGEAPVRETAYAHALNEARWSAREQYQAQRRREDPHRTLVVVPEVR